MFLKSSQLVEFIEKWSKDAAGNIHKMEGLIYNDPASAVVKARLFIEEIIKEILFNENMTFNRNLSLNDKIIFLSNQNILDSNIQSLFHTVRLTGNKAAHVTNFDDLSEAIKLHRTIYYISKWFYEKYVNNNLKIPDYHYPKPPLENSQEMKEVKDDIKKIIEIIEINKGNKNEHSNYLDQTTIEFNNEGNESLLLKEFNKLKDSSKESIENIGEFSRYKEYLHVERKVQIDLENKLNQRKDLNQSNLILLCGSVGDGKSHLLAYLKESKKELLENYQILNDATESFSPSKDAIETLEEILIDFSDEKISTSNKKIILAINLGILHNFITHKREDQTYTRLEKLIEKSELFSSNKITPCYSEEFLDLISFSDYHPYELTKKGAESYFFSTILERIFSPSNQNPFYVSYKEDLSRNFRTMLHENFAFLQNKFVQVQIVQLVIETIVKYKLVISSRAFLNFIADLIIPESQISINFLNFNEKIEQSVPSLLFKRKERSYILQKIYELDPIHIRDAEIDHLIIDLNTSNNSINTINNYISDPNYRNWLELGKESNNLLSFSTFSEFIVRLAFLTNKDFSLKNKSNPYNEYLLNLYALNTGNKKEIRDLYAKIKEVIYMWKGSPTKDYIYISKKSDTIKIAQKLNLIPDISHITEINIEKIENFKPVLSIVYRINPEQKIILEIDYILFELLEKTLNGYCPNKNDEDDAIKFIEFIDKLMQHGEKNKELLIHYLQDSKIYKLYKDEFSSFTFEKE